ncbi:MAG: DMT family transporter [Rubrobacter sp.]|nr:DMT family transporter [Rubrobacter sp.]
MGVDVKRKAGIAIPGKLLDERVHTPLATLTIITALVLPPLSAIGGYELLAQPLGHITSVISAGLLYIGIVASVAAFMSCSIGISGVGAAGEAIFVNLIPLFTAGIAVLTLGERLGLVQLIGGLLVVGGVTLTSSRG